MAAVRSAIHLSPLFSFPEPPLNHWTVIVRFSDTRLPLFESDRHRCILIRSIGMRGHEHGSTYRIHSRGIIALSLGSTSGEPPWI